MIDKCEPLCVIRGVKESMWLSSQHRKHKVLISKLGRLQPSKLWNQIKLVRISRKWGIFCTDSSGLLVG